MPRLWDDSVAAHRTAVTHSIKEATWALASEYGLPGLKMSQIADRVGISRATLYRYFSDVDAILVAWHVDQIEAHVAQLRQASADVSDPGERLEALLACYAAIVRDVPHGTELSTLLHQGAHVAHAEQQAADLFTETIAAAAADGKVRRDVAPADLARYCLYALAAVRSSDAAPPADLLPVVLAGLRA